MPRKYRKRRPRRRRKHRSKLSDKKINTLVERRCLQIAKKVVSKEAYPNFVSYNFGSYGEDEGDIPNYGRVLSSDAVTLEPTTQRLFAGLVTSLLVPKVHATETAGNDPLQDILGRRYNDKIYVKGFKIQGRLKLPASTNNDAVKISIYEVIPKWTHQGQSTDSGQLAAMLVTASLPPTGFQRAPQEDPLFAKTQSLVVTKTYKLHNHDPSEDVSKLFKMSHYFKKPKLIQYMETDNSGSAPLNRFFYVMFQATGINDDVSGPVPTPSARSPLVCAEIRCYYMEKGV